MYSWNRLSYLHILLSDLSIIQKFGNTNTWALGGVLDSRMGDPTELTTYTTVIRWLHYIRRCGLQNMIDNSGGELWSLTKNANTDNSFVIAIPSSDWLVDDGVSGLLPYSNVVLLTALIVSDSIHSQAIAHGQWTGLAYSRKWSLPATVVASNVQYPRGAVVSA